MRQEPTLKTLILRAVLVTLAVLLCLFLLRHFGVLSDQADPPAPDEVVTSEVPSADSGQSS